MSYYDMRLSLDELRRWLDKISCNVARGIGDIGIHTTTVVGNAVEVSATKFPDLCFRVFVGDRLVGGYYTGTGYRPLTYVSQTAYWYLVEGTVCENKEQAIKQVMASGLTMEEARDYVDALEVDGKRFVATR